MDKIVYLHIRKCAGSSFRSLAQKNYGNEGVCWDHRPNKKVSNYLDSDILLGGHFSYIDIAREYDNENVLFISSIRHPLDRIISLFNYHVFSDSWVGKFEGFDENSLSSTLNNCKEFSSLVYNNQCYSLSGEYNFKDTVNVINKNKFIIGEQKSQKAFTKFLGDKLGWISNTPFMANVSKGHNENSLKLSHDDIDKIFSICSEDYKLFEYIKQRDGIFVSPTAEVIKESSFGLSPLKKLIEHESVFLKTKGDIITSPDSEVEVELGIQNESDFDIFTSSKEGEIKASYHLLDDDNGIIEFDGMRTNLPSVLGAKELTSHLLKIKVPSKIGIYYIKTSLVHEGVCWFDEVNANHSSTIKLQVKNK